MSRTLDCVKDENIEVILPPNPSHLPSAIHTKFQLNSTTDSCHSSPEASSPNFDNGFSSEPDVVCRGDPAWVARPPNAFIIFRCEYTRQHTKKGKRVRRPPGASAGEKTLSKRAGEAWSQLPSEERNHYKELAEQAKEEHARLHPDYRFRPAKRGTAQKKRPAPVSRSNSQPLIPSVTTEPVAEPITLPQPSQEQGLPLTQLSPQPPQPPEPPVDIALVKAGRRRSASVPLLTIGSNYSYISGEWTAPQSPGLRTKRSRSALGNRPPSLSMSNMTSPYNEGQSFDPRMLEVDPSSGYIVPAELYGTVQDTSQGTYSYGYAPSDPLTTAVEPTHHDLSSSWNSELHMPEAITPWSSSPELRLLQSHPFSEYTSACFDTSGPNDIMVDVGYSHEDQWAPASTEYSYPSMQTSGLDSSGMLFSSTTLYNEIASAQPEYSQVDAHAAVEHQIPEEAMFALNINDYLR